MYAKVIIEYPVKSLDKSFTYLIPNFMQKELKVGMKVNVPFGSQNVNGFVLEITNNLEEQVELKEITKIVDPDLILTKELMELGKYMQEKTLCTLITSYQTMLPPAYKIKTQKNNYNFYETYITLNNINLNEFILNNKRKVKQIDILNKLNIEKQILKKELASSALNNLLDNGYVKEIKIQKYRSINQDYQDSIINLNKEQFNVYNEIKNSFNTNKIFLLDGVTGSGKTEVYLNLIEDCLNNNKTAIMLAPEISLTMQIVGRFYSRFGSKVAVLHSALSEGEKHDEYLKIMRHEVSIVVGTRSAIFAPLENLGIIIIDEEHSDTYKQDNNPRYNALDMSLFRAKYNNCPILLGSATPSLESMARAQKGVYKLLLLPHRVGSSVLPKITLVNMEQEFKNKNFIFSNLLKDKINERLNHNEQIILLLNRRGFSTFISCSNCGYTYKCPNCDISLTYHKTSNNLMCHYCGYQIKKDDLCPKCHENSLTYLGMGTEKLEQEINAIFPKAKVIRMDQDSTLRKGMHEKIIQDFKEEKYNILLGTSMISKGLDFGGVTLVGVINADTTLNIPDYRSNENAFELLSQVSGRAGRRDKIGEVIIQTFNPNNYILKCVQNNSYTEFYKYEMNVRKELKYPPYYFLVGLKIISKDYNTALDNAKKAVVFLKNNLDSETIVLGPTTASILKYNNNYRFQIIIKYKFDKKITSTLKELDSNFSLNKNVGLEIDFNPFRI
jgi:primosomal protein N' (replication factor Y)